MRRSRPSRGSSGAVPARDRGSDGRAGRAVRGGGVAALCSSPTPTSGTCSRAGPTAPATTCRPASLGPLNSREPAAAPWPGRLDRRGAVVGLGDHGVAFHNWAEQMGTTTRQGELLPRRHGLGPNVAHLGNAAGAGRVQQGCGAMPGSLADGDGAGPKRRVACLTAARGSSSPEPPPASAGRPRGCLCRFRRRLGGGQDAPRSSLRSARRPGDPRSWPPGEALHASDAGAAHLVAGAAGAHAAPGRPRASSAACRRGGRAGATAPRRRARRSGPPSSRPSAGG